MTKSPTGAAAHARTALVVDDDADMCRMLEIALASVGCKATTATSARRAIALLRKRSLPLAFVDARLPDMDGWRLIDELRLIRPTIRIVMISGYYFEADVRIVEALQASMIDGFLAKPLRIDSILAATSVAG